MIPSATACKHVRGGRSKREWRRSGSRRPRQVPPPTGLLGPGRCPAGRSSFVPWCALLPFNQLGPVLGWRSRPVHPFHGVLPWAAIVFPLSGASGSSSPRRWPIGLGKGRVISVARRRAHLRWCFRVSLLPLLIGTARAPRTGPTTTFLRSGMTVAPVTVFAPGPVAAAFRNLSRALPAPETSRPVFSLENPGRVVERVLTARDPFAGPKR